MQTKTIFIAQDGKEFDSENECKQYELGKTPDKIIHKTYLHCEKWEVYEELKDAGYSFDDAILGNIKYILNEVPVTIEIDSKTGEYKILSFE